MKKTTMKFVSIGLLALLVFLFIYYAFDILKIKRPAPPGIHGLYSLHENDRTYTTTFDKDSLLKFLETDGFEIKSGRLNDYDPPWDSLRYLIDNIKCDALIIEPCIEFHKVKENGFTEFRILWIYAAPNESNDTTLYHALTHKYYDCFESILKRHGVLFK